MFSSLLMPKNGLIVSFSMQTPTTTTRAPAGADFMMSLMIPGTPMASNTTGVRPLPARAHAAHAVSSRGSTASSAPMVSAS